jgi:hypothetical protein
MKKSLFVLLMISAGAALFAEGPVVTRYGYFAECPLAVDGGRELVSFPDDSIVQRLMRQVTIKPGNLYLIRITDAKEGDLDVWMWGDTAQKGRALYVIYRAQSFTDSAAPKRGR